MYAHHSDALGLNCLGKTLLFTKTPLTFSLVESAAPVWAQKNNKSVRQTLEHPKYAKLSASCARYSPDFDKPLGVFLLELKERGDEFYKRFLNPNGDAEFTAFRLADAAVARKRGLYLYLVNDEIVYIGRCLDSFGQRINQGYGKIHPKNCFIDGQSTNCRLNALVSQSQGEVFLFVCDLESADEISKLEIELIRVHLPRWNMQLA